MKNRIAVIVGGSISLIVALLALFFLVKPGNLLKIQAAPPSVTKQADKAPRVERAPGVPVKRVLQDGMAGLTVRMLNSKNRDMSIRLKAFKVSDQKSSLYTAAFTSNRMQELLPGTYDIEIETMPPMLYKGVALQEGKEEIVDLGGVSGSLEVKIVGCNKKPTSYPVRILYPKTRIVAVGASTNRSIEVIPGTYDLEIGTIPALTRDSVKIETGKETLIDLGSVTGSLIVKAVDKDGKEMKTAVRIKKSGTGELVTMGLSGKLIELLPGVYNLEIVASPSQVKNDVKVSVCEETPVEFTLQQSGAAKFVERVPAPVEPSTGARKQ